MRPRDSGERESTLGTPGGQKLGGTVRRSQAAGSCSGPGPLHSASVHTLPGVKGGPDSRRPGPFRREGKQKVEESGRRTPDPSSAHLVPPRPGGSRSESARRGSRGTAAVSTESWPPRPRPLLGLRPAPPRPRPPGAPGTGWLAPRQAPPREEGSRSGLRVAGKRCVLAWWLGGPGGPSPRLLSFAEAWEGPLIPRGETWRTLPGSVASAQTEESKPARPHPALLSPSF